MLYVRRGLEISLTYVLAVGEEMYCWYGYSGYSSILYLYTPFTVSNLCEALKAFNVGKAQASGTVEWLFKEVKL